MAGDDIKQKEDATTSEYKGHDMLNLPLGGTSDKTFNFGLTKAKTILLYVDEIQKFVDDAEKKKEEESKAE